MANQVMHHNWRVTTTALKTEAVRWSIVWTIEKTSKQAGLVT